MDTFQDAKDSADLGKVTNWLPGAQGDFPVLCGWA